MSESTTGQMRLTEAQARLIRSAGVASVSVALTLVVIKVWAFAATGSIAMLSSLADSALDLLASSMTLIAVRYALEPADREHRFGHGKLEAIAGLVQAFVILASAVYIAFEAFSRLIVPTPVSSPVGGSVVMGISLLLTIGLVLFQRHVVASTGSIAIGADAMHYKADVLTNVAVLIALAASSGLGWHRADPILGLAVVIVILGSVRAIVLQALDVLLDRELPGSQRAAILALVRLHPEVRGVHDLRTRTSGTHEFIQFHMELAPEMSLSRAHQISDEVEAVVRKEYPRAEVIIHADPHGLEDPHEF